VLNWIVRFISIIRVVIYLVQDFQQVSGFSHVSGYSEHRMQQVQPLAQI